jgi:hypothetical protein
MLDKQENSKITILPLIKVVFPFLSILPTIQLLASLIFRRPHRWWCSSLGLFEGLTHGFKSRGKLADRFSQKSRKLVFPGSPKTNRLELKKQNLANFENSKIRKNQAKCVKRRSGERSGCRLRRETLLRREGSWRAMVITPWTHDDKQ